MPMAVLAVRELKKAYTLNEAVYPVLKNVSFTAELGQITVLLGKSGCGKTTLLRLLCGLEKPDGGRIICPAGMQLGMMFQEARLLPWLSCEENITLGLEKNYDRERVAKLLEIVGLNDFAKAYPHQLSGGMQQRTALARTLAQQSQMILMDEPFSALDYFTRLQMQTEVLRIKRLLRTGILFVTHNIDEALMLGDKLLIMQEGVIAREIALPREEQRDLLQEPYIGFKKEILGALMDL